MVQLVLRLSSDPKEWKIIELQGQLETRDSVPLNSMHIGEEASLPLPLVLSRSWYI